MTDSISPYRPFQETSQFALYLHIPFCVTKCPYCDFNSYALSHAYDPSKPLDQEALYSTALISELCSYAESPPWKGKTISSIFIGGGTPSLMQPESIAKILEATRKAWDWDSRIEVTLEANPATLREQLGAEKLAGFKAAGVNRISFGAQSIRAEKLKALGRLHNVDDTLHSLEAARSVGFARVSVDLIYGLPTETIEDWNTELQEILNYSLTHLSAYSLTIEPGTEFSRLQRKGVLMQAQEDALADMYVATQQTVSAAGLLQYEVSNFSLVEQECRHNLSYWRWESYLGVGAGAHSFSRRNFADQNSSSRRWANIPKPSHYIARVNETGHATQNTEELTLSQEKLEVLYCFLRTKFGFPLTEFETLFGLSIRDDLQETQSRLLSEGLIFYDADTIYLTPRGYLFSDYVLCQFAGILG